MLSSFSSFLGNKSRLSSISHFLIIFDNRSRCCKLQRLLESKIELGSLELIYEMSRGRLNLVGRRLLRGQPGFMDIQILKPGATDYSVIRCDGID